MERLFGFILLLIFVNGKKWYLFDIYGFLGIMTGDLSQKF